MGKFNKYERKFEMVRNLRKFEIIRVFGDKPLRLTPSGMYYRTGTAHLFSK